MQIEKGIPIPPRADPGSRGILKQAAKTMEIGDSVLFKSKPEARSFYTTLNSLYGRGSMLMRTSGEGIRVWRVK